MHNAILADNAIVQQGGFTLRANMSTTPEQQTIAVLGASGAGKSMFLSFLAGFLPVVAGQLWVDGCNVTRVIPAMRPFSLVFQDNNLFPHLTVERNVGLGLSPRLFLTAADRETIKTALGSLGLAGYQQYLPEHLSGGQQSRVALARVLLQNRPYLLLDEPFSALGPQLKLDILYIVIDLLRRQNMRLFMVTHDPLDAVILCDWVLTVVDGVVAKHPIAMAEFIDAPPLALQNYFGERMVSDMRRWYKQYKT